MHKLQKDLYYKALEMILKGDYPSAREMLEEWKRSPSGDLKAETLLLMLGIREKALRELQVNEKNDNRKIEIERC